jgi:quinohemoprotein ethanol dehydrogenase
VEEKAMPEPPAVPAGADAIAQGAAIYGDRCGNCHGFNTISGGTVPDLRYMSADTHAAFKGIVFGGTRMANGMASFKGVITEEQADAVYAYIVSRAHETRN